MENRPSVRAALKLKQSLKQRLGKKFNTQARLGLPKGALARGAIWGQGLPIIQRRVPPGGGLRGALATGSLLRGGLSLWGQSPLLQGGQALAAPQTDSRKGAVSGRGDPGRGGLGHGAKCYGGIGGRGRAVIGQGRGDFGGQGHGQGRGALTHPVLTKEQLDNELDAYMSNPKGHLDAELDAYMALIDPETNDWSLPTCPSTF